MKIILIILIYILITLIVTKIYFKQLDYFTTNYGYRCADCPSNSTSPPGSMAQTDCKCNAGYGKDGSDCTICQTGYYKTEVGNKTCQSCEVGTYKKNTGRGTCRPCEDNKYQNSIGASSCIDCPSNSISISGSTAQTDCLCNAGYEGNNGGPCTICQEGFYKTDVGNGTCAPCEAGKYKSGEGAGSCQDCPTYSTTSSSGSKDISDCKCNMGFTGSDGGECTACQAGKYKSSIGSGPCEDCEAGTYQDELGSQTCKLCAYQCGVDQYIVGCGGVDAGICKDNWGVTSCGWNNKGQLGINSTQSERAHAKVRIQNNMFINIKITKISAGDLHSLFLTREGHVYSCGLNDSGQLGFDSGDWEDDPNDGREWDSENLPYHIKPVLLQKWYRNASVNYYENYSNITITKISAGYKHSLFLDNSGNVYGCGYNQYGQLGLNNEINRTTPRLIYEFNNVTEISTGKHHNLFLKTNGHVYSCGYNGQGQLGLINYDSVKKATPQLIRKYYNDALEINYDSIEIDKISAGSYYSLFLTRNGRVYSCGYNIKGQLGLGTSGFSKNESRPKLIRTYYGNNDETINYDSIEIDKISAGDLHSLFLTKEGHVYSCGKNDSGQLSLGTSGSGEDKSSPTLMTTYYGNNDETINYSSIVIDKISAGESHNLFLTSNNQVFSCGKNDQGQLGLDSNEDKITTPRLIEITSNSEITEISCGGHHSLFLESYGDWVACTSNTIVRNQQCIQCGDGEQPNSSKTECEACPVYSCGQNTKGQLGLDSNEDKITTPSIIETYYNSSSVSQNYDMITITKISCGYLHSLFLTRTGLVYSCGYNRYGQLGFNSGNKGDDPTDGKKWDSENHPYHIRPILISGLSNVREIACGYYHSLFLTREGHVYGCGYNRYGQLGFNSGTMAQDNDPTDGRYWDNQNYPYHTRPVLINKYYDITSDIIYDYSSIRITEISAGYNYSLFLTSKGRVYSCGWNYYGQLGLDSTDNQTIPQLIETYYVNELESYNYDRITITKISCGFAYSLFLTSEGHVYSCGFNEYGELGFDSGDMDADNSYDDGRGWMNQYKPYHTRPFLIETYYNSDLQQITYTNIKITKISTGHYHTLFLTSEGLVYSCGNNQYGKLGLDSSEASIKTPRLISGLSNVREIACGYFHSLFLTSEGRVYSCGKNDLGQLGLGTSGTDSNESSPTLITNVSNVSEIACGYDHSILICG